MRLTANEELELRYMQARGFKWIARDCADSYNIKKVWVYKARPTRRENDWVSNDDSIDDYGECNLGEYAFLKWEDEPMEIEKLLRENGDIPLVEPKGNEL